MHDDENPVARRHAERQLEESGERMREKLKVLTRQEIVELVGELLAFDLAEVKGRNELRDLMAWLIGFRRDWGDIKKQVRVAMVGALLTGLGAFALSHWK